MQTKKSASSQLEDGSQFAQLDEALQSYILAQTSKVENLHKLQNQSIREIGVSYSRP